MGPSNNEVGNAWTLHILGQLSESWPRRVDFNALDLATATSIKPALDNELEAIFDDLFRWLKREGFVEYTQEDDSYIFDVSLTAKAMDAIGHALPTKKDSPGQFLKNIAADTASTAGKAAIAETIGHLVGAAARSFTGSSA